MSSEAPGKGLLKFTGVLFIILGLLSAIFTILGLVGVGLFGSWMGLTDSETGLSAGATSTGGALERIMIAALITMLILALFEIVTGIVGLSNSEKPHNAGVCIALAIIMIILQIAAGLIGTFSWVSIVGLLLPVLYLIGALQNRSAAGRHYYSGAH